MDFRPLGNSGLKVSRFCLGTMTFGDQTDEPQARRQLDLAVDFGINFVDTAESYPSPSTPENYGIAEQIIGRWLHNNDCRDRMIVASKCAGPADWAAHIRSGRTVFDRANLTAGLHNSLARLQTDYIDFYYLHWPDRATNFFGQLDYKPAKQERTFDMAETLSVLNEFISAGKIRAFGVCNETAWGVMRFLALADASGLQRPSAMQVPLNLLNRVAEIGLAEIAHRESVPLISYSPLAMGLLTGKYLTPQPPANVRLSRHSHYRRLRTPETDAASAAYVDLAREFNIEPAHMALAFVQSRTLVASCILGATSSAQLATNLESYQMELPRALTKQMDQIHRRYPNPCP